MKHAAMVALAIWSFAGTAAAQPAQPAPSVDDGGHQAVPPPEPEARSARAQAKVTEPQQLQWQVRFDQARALMERGEFESAARDFEALRDSATREVDRLIAGQNAELCRHWVAGKARLVYPGASSIEALENRRTTGELATLYLNAVGYGLGSGIVVALYTEPSDAAGFILPTLGLAGVSAGAVYLLDKNLHLGYGVPQSIVAGLQIGMLEGYALTLWHFASVNAEDEWSAETIGTLIWGSATAGAVLGGVLGSKLRTSPGRAAFVESAARWTAFSAGLAVGGAFGDRDTADEAGLLAAAIGTAAGAVGGYFVARAEQPSVARARFIDLGGVSGTLVAGGLFLAADQSDGSSLALVSAVGMAGGVAIAYGLTRGMDKDPPPSEMTEVGTRTTAAVAPTLDGSGFTVGIGGTL